MCQNSVPQDNRTPYITNIATLTLKSFSAGRLLAQCLMSVSGIRDVARMFSSAIGPYADYKYPHPQSTI